MVNFFVKFGPFARESIKDAEPIPTIGNISIAVGPIAGELTILQQAAH